MRQRILFAIVIVLFLFAGYLVGNLGAPVEAKSSAETCELVAHAGAIDYYFCQPNDGPSFLTNSVGFMQVVQ